MITNTDDNDLYDHFSRMSRIYNDQFDHLIHIYLPLGTSPSDRQSSYIPGEIGEIDSQARVEA